MDKLKPCPFCGGEAEAFHPHSVAGGWYAECYAEYNDGECCEARTAIYDTAEEAIKAWNTRAQED